MPKAASEATSSGGASKAAWIMIPEPPPPAPREASKGPAPQAELARAAVRVPSEPRRVLAGGRGHPKFRLHGGGGAGCADEHPRGVCGGGGLCALGCGAREVRGGALVGGGGEGRPEPHPPPLFARPPGGGGGAAAAEQPKPRAHGRCLRVVCKAARNRITLPMCRCTYSYLISLCSTCSARRGGRGHHVGRIRNKYCRRSWRCLQHFSSIGSSIGSSCRGTRLCGVRPCIR